MLTVVVKIVEIAYEVGARIDGENTHFERALREREVFGRTIVMGDRIELIRRMEEQLYDIGRLDPHGRYIVSASYVADDDVEYEIQLIRGSMR